MAKKFVGSVMCGVYISIGATGYLLCLINQSPIAGAFIFGAGILLVTAFFGMLVTRVISLLAFGEYGVTDVIIALIGNTIGCVLYAALLYPTRLNAKILEQAVSVTETKLSDGLPSLFILAVLCGFLVACACLTPKSFPDNRIASLSLSVMFVAVFVLCGFEHIVADGFYFAFYTINKGFKAEMVPAFLVIAFGNIVGGVGTGYLDKWRRKEK
jgi:formate/nitrite transporter FocA (FNT family)